MSTVFISFVHGAVVIVTALTRSVRDRFDEKPFFRAQCSSDRYFPDPGL